MGGLTVIVTWGTNRVLAAVEEYTSVEVLHCCNLLLIQLPYLFTGEKTTVDNCVYSRPSQYRPSQYCRPPNTAARFKSQIGFLGLCTLPIPPFRNTAGFSPVPRTAVLGGTTV